MIRVRILNKAKDGVILKAGKLEQKISWEDFNSAWAIDPPDLCRFSSPEASFGKDDAGIE